LNLLQKWQRAIPRKDCNLRLADPICELHFDPKFVQKYFDKEETLLRAIPILDPKAVPSIFPNCPAYLTKKIPQER